MSKKHVIIIRNANNYDFGGGERFPVFVADILKNLDFIPLIVSRSPKLLAFAHSRGIKTVHGWWWPRQNWSGKSALLFPVYLGWQLVLTLWYLGLFLRKNPDVIHIQSKDDFIAATLAGRLSGKRVIWTDHADLKHIWKNIGVWNKNPVGKLVYLAAKHAHSITVVSESERRLVSDNLPQDSPVRKNLQVIYNGVIDLGSNYTAKSDGGEFTYCVASRLVTDKGIKEVIDAFTKLSKDKPDVRLLLLGDGPEADRFKTYTKGNQNITFLGHQNNPFTYISNADVFVHPTYHEGFSVALVEASMLSRPIIATAVGGNVEIIHDRETGLLVPPKDVPALYEAMKLLYEDKELRQSIAKNARIQYEKRFQFDQTMQEGFIPLYEGDPV